MTFFIDAASYALIEFVRVRVSISGNCSVLQVLHFILLVLFLSILCSAHVGYLESHRTGKPIEYLMTEVPTYPVFATQWTLTDHL